VKSKSDDSTDITGGDWSLVSRVKRHRTIVAEKEIVVVGNDYVAHSWTRSVKRPGGYRPEHSRTCRVRFDDGSTVNVQLPAFDANSIARPGNHAFHLVVAIAPKDDQ
jgi:hypothetical protein